MKFEKVAQTHGDSKVTPLVGVWIEMLTGILSRCSNLVTPLVGVWIEIYTHFSPALLSSVTPLVGVWIEILSAVFQPPAV